MDFKRSDLFIEVKDLHFTHPHYREDSQTYLLRALLVLPRPNVASREEVRILEATESGELIGAGAEFHEKALFKQTVEGPFAIGLQLSEAVAEDGFADIIGEIVSSTVATAGNLIAARAIPILRSGIRTSARFFAGRLKDKDPVIIAEDIQQVTRSGDHTLTLNLTAVETLKKSVPKRGPKATRRPPPKVILEEGDLVATAEIQLTFFS